ncbi:PIG-L family deacetylase [Streptosporangium sp. NPDC049644]|uniref:PIG-L family deacetylase n=1 Tax=Streptosporangium sp. NPDC049644 TaxID=3155507 RepID=UPI00343E527B
MSGNDRDRDRTVVVSPHPDDAVLSAWHVLTRQDVRDVVTVFAGIPPAGARPSPWDRLTGCAEPAVRAAERRSEDEAALGLAGCAPVHLDFVGASHRGGRQLDEAALREELAAALGAAAVVWIPAGIGGHPDHLAARDAALAATPGALRLLYADLPYAARFGWPGWVDATTPSEAGGLDVDGWLRAQLDGLGLGRARVHRLTEESLAGKRAAIGCYRSQVAALAADAADDFPNGRTWAFEVTWEIR